MSGLDRSSLKYPSWGKQKTPQDLGAVRRRCCDVFVGYGTVFGDRARDLAICGPCCRTLLFKGFQAVSGFFCDTAGRFKGRLFRDGAPPFNG